MRMCSLIITSATHIECVEHIASTTTATSEIRPTFDSILSHMLRHRLGSVIRATPTCAFWHSCFRFSFRVLQQQLLSHHSTGHIRVACNGIVVPVPRVALHTASAIERRNRLHRTPYYHYSKVFAQSSPSSTLSHFATSNISVPEH